MSGQLEEVRQETTQLLRELVKIDTTNPPGNETAAARFLRGWLEDAGLKCEILESAPGRGSLITRIKGNGKGPSLLLLSHLDVVPATPEEWSVPPFSGTVKDNFVWGRGTLDCKALTAVEATVMKLLKKDGVNPKGDIILAATADEEGAGKQGVGWLAKNHPDKIKADYVINEGGGFSFPVDSRLFFVVQTAEKGVMWLKVKAKGRPGHGSMPGAADNAVLTMAKAADALGSYHSKIRAVPSVKQLINELAKERGTVSGLLSGLMTSATFADTVLDRMAKKDLASAEYLRALLRNTIAPTTIKGGTKENIIPSECETIFDCRVLPRETKETLLSEIKQVLRDAGLNLEKFEFEFVTADEPSESPVDTPLYVAIRTAMQKFEPNARIVPFMATGGTDSRFLRSLGAVCYGFAPMKTDLPLNEFLKMAHGIDERISTDNLVFGVSVLYELVKEFCK